MDEESVQPKVQSMKEILEHQLDHACREDFKVYMDDKQVTLEEALKRCVQERTVYMPDYVLDDRGVLKQVRFDRINL